MPSLYGSAGGANRKLRELYARDSGGTTRKLREMWGRDAGGVNRKVFSAGARLASAPYVAMDTGGHDTIWSLTTSSTCNIDSSGLHASVEAQANNRNNNDPVSSGMLWWGIVVPLDLGVTESFVSGSPCLRASEEIQAVLENPNYGDSHYAGTQPDRFGVRLNFYGGFDYADTSGELTGNSPNYAIAPSSVNASGTGPYNKEIVYLHLYCYINDRSVGANKILYCRMSFTVPNNAFTVIGNGGTEYPVIFE